jgi:uncharacterized protein YndB with AHSA1/START domain
MSSVMVKKSIEVRGPPERAFHVFTERMTEWWPLETHHIGKAKATKAVMEPFVGGRWYERGEDGSECEWGKVLAWEPPGRLVLSWEITCDWHHDAVLQTEVEVRFTKKGAGTEVSLEHRMLERYGEKAEEMRGIFDAEGGWRGLLGAFAARAAEDD